MSITTYRYVEFLDNNDFEVKALATTDKLITLNVSNLISLDLSGTAYASGFTLTPVNNFPIGGGGKPVIQVGSDEEIEVSASHAYYLKENAQFELVFDGGTLRIVGTNSDYSSAPGVASWVSNTPNNDPNEIKIEVEGFLRSDIAGLKTANDGFKTMFTAYEADPADATNGATAFKAWLAQSTADSNIKVLSSALSNSHKTETLFALVEPASTADKTGMVKYDGSWYQVIEGSTADDPDTFVTALDAALTTPLVVEFVGVFSDAGTLGKTQTDYSKIDSYVEVNITADETAVADYSIDGSKANLVVSHVDTDTDGIIDVGEVITVIETTDVTITADNIADYQAGGKYANIVVSDSVEIGTITVKSVDSYGTKPGAYESFGAWIAGEGLAATSSEGTEITGAIAGNIMSGFDAAIAELGDEYKNQEETVDLVKLFNQVGYSGTTPTGTDVAAGSSIVVDSSTAKRFIFDSDAANASEDQINGLRFSDPSGINVTVDINKSKVDTLDFSYNDAGSFNLIQTRAYTPPANDTPLKVFVKPSQNLSFSLSNVMVEKNVLGSSSADTITGLNNSSWVEIIYGNAGADTIDGAAGDDGIYGGAGADTILGGTGNDQIDGGDGNDTITGGAGNDLLDGGSGSDTFVFSAGDGADGIRGFNVDEDTIKIGGQIYVKGLAGTTETTDVNTGYRFISYNSGADSITLKDEEANTPVVIKEVSGERWGNYITFEAVAPDGMSSKNIKAMEFTLDWDPSDFSYIDGSLTSGTIVTNAGVANLFVHRGSSKYLDDTDPNFDPDLLETVERIPTLADLNAGYVSYTQYALGTAMPFAIPPITGVTLTLVDSSGETLAAGDRIFDFMLFRTDPTASINDMTINYVNFTEDQSVTRTPTADDLNLGYVTEAEYNGAQETTDTVTADSAAVIDYSDGGSKVDSYVSHVDVTAAGNTDGAIDVGEVITFTVPATTVTFDVPVEKGVSSKKYDFNYVTDKVTTSLKTHGGIVANSPKMYISNKSIVDGLSIVPVATSNGVTQYEVVLNVSQPMIDQASLMLPLDSYSIDITGDIDPSSLAKEVDSNITIDYETDVIVSTGPLFNENYNEGWANRSGTFADDITINVTLDTFGLSLFDGTSGIDDGRYSLLTFLAEDDNGGSADISYISSSYSDPSTQYGISDTIEIDVRQLDATNLATSTYVTNVNDGAEVYVLGEKWYDNPMSNLRAVTSNDALQVLEMTSAINKESFSNIKKIAADFDRDGGVTAADAAEILRYAANMKYYDDGVSLSEVKKPEWFYVDKINHADNYTSIDAIEFDQHIDLFVGQDETISATAVLIGDVSASYTPLPIM